MIKQVLEKMKYLFARLSQLSQTKFHIRKKELTLLNIGGITLRTLKLLSNVVFVLVFLGGLFGAGIALGYVVRIFYKVEVPQKDQLVKQIRNISSISELKYADGSSISAIDSDLMRIAVESKNISDNVKKAVIATEDENFHKHNGVVTKAVLRATLGSVANIGSSSGGSTLTQQLIKLWEMRRPLSERQLKLLMLWL